MSNKTLIDEYFDWMYDLVCNDKYSKKLSYRKLFAYLYDVDFAYTIPMDSNRAEDGIDLRYRYGYENGYENAVIAHELDFKPCSMLEMMIALALRCEENIMDNPEIGNRTGQWFWNMIVSLGMGHMNDVNFDRYVADEIIDIFQHNEYKRNGMGGLFTVHDADCDLRNVEIWYQMCLYLDVVMNA